MFMGYMFLALTIGLALAALVFAITLLTLGAKKRGGAPWMLEFSEGADAALSCALREQAAVLIPAVLGVAALVFSFLFFPPSQLRGGAAQAAFSFLSGAGFHAAAAFVCSRILAGCILRTAAAANRSASEVFTLAIRMAGASSILTLAFSLAGVAGLFMLTGGWNDARGAVMKISAFCFGSAFTALFLRLSGGLWSGAPAATGAGPFRDRVLGAALTGSAAFDSAAAENISAMILGAVLWPVYGPKCVIFPFFARALGLAVCAAGVMSARPSAGGDHAELLDKGLAAAGAAALAGLFLGCVFGLDKNMWLFTAAVIGLVSASLFTFSARYYGEYKPRLARLAAVTSSSRGQIDSAAGALSAGFESAAVPAALTAAALVGSYYCGVRGLENYCVSGALGERACGLYGIVLAVIGALSVSGYVLALGVFGAIIGGAHDLCEMTGQETELRQKGGALAAAGRSGTAAAAGYSGAAAVLAAVLLLSAYMGETARLTGLPFDTVNFAGVEGLAGGLLGAVLLAVFCAFCLGVKVVPGMGSGSVLKRVLLTASPALFLPSAALAFRRSGQGPEVMAAILISVIVCGGFVSAFLGNSAAVFENPRIGEGSSALDGLIKLLPAAALVLAVLFV